MHDPDPETPEQRTARQSAQLRRLAERAMRLAEAAADRAERELTAPDPPETTPQRDAPKRDAKTPDYPRLFATYASLVRHVIALERRLEAGPATLRGGTSRYVPAQLDDPRQRLLRDALHHAARDNPARTQLRRTLDQRVEQELLDDPAGTIPLDELFATICTEFALPNDPAQLHDDFVFFNKPKPKPITHWSQLEGTDSS